MESIYIAAAAVYQLNYPDVFLRKPSYNPYVISGTSKA